METLGGEAASPARVYFTGGATAVLVGWRESTIDVDVKLVPESDRLLQAIARLKDSLQINVELAAPSDFIPVKPGWEDCSPFIASEGALAFHHFDLYAQAIAKVERGHSQDLEDVREMVARNFVDPARALEYFSAIEHELYRYPALDPLSFRRSVEAAFGRG